MLGLVVLAQTSSNNSNSSNNNNNNNNNNDNNNDYSFYGGGSGYVYQQAIGGIGVNANGIVYNTPTQILSRHRETMVQNAEAISPEMGQSSELRKVSLKKLDREVRRCSEQGEFLPDAVRYLGGLTSITNVVAVPEENDVFLVGPAEGWTFDKSGAVVGKKSGKPIMLLEDLITLMRIWNSPNPEVLSCSIDPTNEGRMRVKELQRKTTARNFNPVEYAKRLEEAFGLNTVKFTGVPADSRIARIMVAADYKLKQMGLGSEGAPKGIHSFVSTINSSTNAAMNPRFWLVPEYGSLSHSEDRLTWDLSDSRVKTLTESDYISSTGSRIQSGRSDRTALRWAEQMTQKYPNIAKNDVVFAELRNCMEMAVAVALIHKENLLPRTGCNPSTLWEPHEIELPRYAVPMGVKSIGVVEKKTGGVALGCGGVEINPWEALETASLNPELNRKRSSLVAFQGDQWWSN